MPNSPQILTVRREIRGDTNDPCIGSQVAKVVNNHKDAPDTLFRQHKRIKAKYTKEEHAERWCTEPKHGYGGGAESEDFKSESRN